MGQNPQGCGEKLRMPKWNRMCGKIEQGRTNWFDQKKADAREVSKPYDNVVKAGLPPFCSRGGSSPSSAALRLTALQFFNFNQVLLKFQRLKDARFQKKRQVA